MPTFRKLTLRGFLVLAVILAGGGWWAHHQFDAPTPRPPLTGIAQANATAATHILHALPVALQQARGVVTPALIDFTTTGLPTQANLIEGIHREWQLVNTARLHHLPPALTDSVRIPKAVWQAGWRQAAQDAMMAAGNDPLAVVQNAGPGSAPHFQSLLATLYRWDTQPGSAHWMSHMVAAIGQGGTAGTVMLYPATHQVPHMPVVMTLMSVPLTLTEYGYSPGSGAHLRTAVQTGQATMVLTHGHHHWHWWIEALSLGPQKAVTFAYQPRG